MQSGIGNAGRGAVIGGLLVSGAALYGAEPARTDVLDGRVPVRDLSPPACIAVTDVWAFDLAIGNEPSGDMPFTEPARAQSPEIDELVSAFQSALGELSESMIAWIDRAGSYRVEGLLERPPGIVFALVGDVLDLGPVVMPVEPGMRGAYHPVVNAVVLVLPWHIDDIDDRSVLLHELVHAVQWQARDWPCAAEMEWDAYGLQREWLSEHGIEMQMDWLTVGILSSCPEVSP